MADTNISTKSRNFSWADAKRSFICMVILAVVGTCYCLVLPAIQSLFIPSAAGGRTGPWVIRPILALRFGAMAVMAAATIPVMMKPLRKRWEREDIERGTRYDPFFGRSVNRVLLFIKGFLLLLVYASALIFYLFSWTIIGTDGIKQRLPWGTLRHSFQDIASLETIPDGWRSESLVQNGPWFSINLRSGRTITLSDDNEGITPEELAGVTSFIASRSGLDWVRRRDAHPR